MKFKTFYTNYVREFTVKQMLFTIFIILLAFTGYCQQFLNFDFENESVEGPSRPWGWALDAWGNNAFSTDTARVYNGKFSLKAHSGSVSEQLPALQYNLEPFYLSGKRTELKGYMYSQLNEGRSFISFGFVYRDPDRNYSDSSDIIYKTSGNTDEWEVFETSFTVPENAISVFIKIGLEGKGTIWYDNLRLIVDDKEYKELPVAGVFSNSEIEWIKENSIPFGNIQNADHESVDFDFFRTTIGDSRIVALGESTHGTSEFFKLKHQVFKYLVKESGFRIFALEDNQLACEKVNEYVLGKSGTNAEEAMSHLFAVWKTREMKSLIEWMKEWNLSNPEDAVYFAGFDMQDYKLPLQALSDFLSKQNPELMLEMDGFDSFAGNHFEVNDSVKQYWLEKTTYLYETISKSSDTSKQHQLALQYAKLIQQFTENVLKGHWSLYRDEAMAENIIWLADIMYPKDKIFVWAHDVHISKSNHPDELYNLNYGIAMGHFLKKAFGNDYKMYGLMTYSGAYLALKSYTNHERVNAPLYPAPKGSLDEALHQVSLETKRRNLFLDFQNSEVWLKRPLPFRFANHVNIDYGFFQRISLPYQFDGIFFIDQTSPSNYLVN